MSTVLRRLARQRYPHIALQAYWDCLHFGRTGLLTVAQLEDRVLRCAGDIPEGEARSAIRRGIAAAQRQTAKPAFDDPLPFGEGSQ
jgi:hypothetical protein